MPKNEQLVFDESTQTYRLMPSGIRLPSVSEIVNTVFPFKGEGVAVERAANFGTAVHKALELDILGTLDFDTVDDAIKPYLTQWNRVCKAFDIVTDKSNLEIISWSKKYMFAGRIDFVFDSVGDWKTGQRSPINRIKIAAYRHLWNISNPKNKKDKGFIFYLDGTANVNIIEKERPSDFATFLACLEIWNFKKMEALK